MPTFLQWKDRMAGDKKGGLATDAVGVRQSGGAGDELCNAEC